MKISKYLSILALCMLLYSCSNTWNSEAKREQLFISKITELHTMPQETLVELVESGNIGALHEYARRFCLGIRPETEQLCQKNMLLAAEAGNPDAMSQIAIFMQVEDIPIYNVYESYKWIWIASHFQRDAYFFGKDDIAHDLIENENRIDYTIIKLGERSLSADNILSARYEAKTKMKEIALKLENHCKEWQNDDYVCFYQLGQQPSYEKYEKGN